MSDRMRTGYDRLIDEYMAGTMTPAAQREFDRMLATDPSLRRLLDAELEIARSMRRTIGTIPNVQPAMSASLLARIAETAPAASRVPSGAGASTAGMAGSAWSWVVTAMVICGVGGGLLLSSNRQSGERTDAVRDTTVRPLIAPSPAAPAATPTALSSTPAPEPGSGLERSSALHSPDNRTIVRDSTIATLRPAPPVSVARATKPRTPAPDQPAARQRDDERAIREYMEQKEKSAPTPVEVDDRIHTTVRMDRQP